MVEDKTFQLLVATLGVVCAVFAVRKWTRTSGGIPGQFIRFGMSVSQSFIYLNSRIIIIIKTKNIRIQETLLFKRKSNILLMYRSNRMACGWLYALHGSEFYLHNNEISDREIRPNLQTKIRIC